MGKKKREHIVFDKMLVPKKTVPFQKINTLTRKSGKEINNKDMMHMSN